MPERRDILSTQSTREPDVVNGMSESIYVTGHGPKAQVYSLECRKESFKSGLCSLYRLRDSSEIQNLQY